MNVTRLSEHELVINLPGQEQYHLRFMPGIGLLRLSSGDGLLKEVTQHHYIQNYENCDKMFAALINCPILKIHEAIQFVMPYRPIALELGQMVKSEDVVGQVLNFTQNKVALIVEGKIVFVDRKSVKETK